MINLEGMGFTEESKELKLGGGESSLKGAELFESGAVEEDSYTEFERSYNLRDWEADFGAAAPNAYAVTRTIADLVPYGRYVFPSGRDAYAAKGTGKQTLELALEALTILPSAVIGKGIKVTAKGVGALGRAAGKPLVRIAAEKSGLLLPEAKVMANPFADAVMTQIPKFEMKSVSERLMGKYGLMGDEAEAVLQGKPWVWRSEGRSGAFTPQMTDPMKGLFTKDGVRLGSVSDDIKKWSLPEQQQAISHWSGQLDRVANEVLQGTKYKFDDLFRAQAARLYGDAGKNMSLKTVGVDELGNILRDTLEHGSRIRKAIDITAWSQLKPVRKVLGGMEKVWGTDSNLFKPFKNILRSSHEAEINYVRSWQLMLAGKEVGGQSLLKMTADKLGRVAIKELYSRKELELAGKLAMDINLAQMKGEGIELINGLMAKAPEKVQVIAKTLHEWYDMMYADHVTREIPLLFNKAGLTVKGQKALNDLMSRPGGVIELTNKTFMPGNNLPYPEKIKMLEGILGSTRKLITKENLNWFSEKPFDSLTRGDKISLAKRLGKLKNEDLILRTNKGKKGFTGYLENYTAQIPKESVRPWTAEGGLPEEMTPAYMKPRILDEPNYEVVTDIPTLVSSRARMQAKGLFLYPEVDAYKDFVKALPVNLRAYSEHWINRTLGIPSPVDTKVAKFLSRFSLKGWDERRVIDVAQKINDLTYMGGIGFKPFSALRNFIQYPLMVPAELGGVKDAVWLIPGMRKSASPAFRNEVIQRGLIAEYSPDLLVNLQVSKYGSHIDKLRDFSMWMFKASDRHIRYWTAGAADTKWNYHFAKYGENGVISPSKLDGFMAKVNLNSREEWVRNDIRKLLQTNTPESITEAKWTYIKDVVADSQFLYSREESPLIGHTWGAPGRVALVFQSWWMNYADDLGKWLFRTPEPGGKWLSPSNERLFTFLLSSALAYEIMEPVWGARTAATSVGLGPLPLDISLPPTIRPFQAGIKTIVQAGALLTPWGDIDQTRRQMVQLLKDTAIFVPGGVQAYHMVQGAKREGGEGVAKALIRYKPDRETEED